ncbi:MAG: ABC transporter ATP-binding protein [Pseudomonadota bacterium]
MSIVVTEVEKRFIARGREVQALAGIDLEIEDGEFVAMVGPSGCGKTTLLNMMAGIALPTGGTVVHDGRTIDGPNRAVGYMTQVDSLLPWRTVFQNVVLPLQLRGVERRRSREVAQQMLALVGLDGFGHHFPTELSGGMRKRAALAQLLSYEPATLLMDEPFGALDAQLKLVMQAELLKIWRNSGKTIVFVTHDLAEAIALADRVIVFSGRPGKIKLIQPIDLERPRDIFTVRFQPAFQTLYEGLWAELAPEISKGEAL